MVEVVPGSHSADELIEPQAAVVMAKLVGRRPSLLRLHLKKRLFYPREKREWTPESWRGGAVRASG